MYASASVGDVLARLTEGSSSVAVGDRVHDSLMLCPRLAATLSDPLAVHPLDELRHPFDGVSKHRVVCRIAEHAVEVGVQFGQRGDIAGVDGFGTELHQALQVEELLGRAPLRSKASDHSLQCLPQFEQIVGALGGNGRHARSPPWFQLDESL